MTEKEKMLAGHIYDACNPEILSELFTTQDAVFEYNQIRPTDHALRTKKIKQILGKTGERVIVNQPFHCDYGSNISVGEGFFANFNLTVLDEAPVTIGDNCFIGPNVGLYTACHPTDPVARNSRQEEFPRNFDETVNTMDMNTAVQMIRCPMISRGDAGSSSGKNAGNSPHIK